jgi:hypothetical protein
MAAKRIPLKYKIIAYIVTWLVALFAAGLHRNLSCSRVLLFPLAQSLVDAPSLRWPGRFAHL